MQNLAKTSRNPPKSKGLSRRFAAILQGFRGRVKKQLNCLSINGISRFTGGFCQFRGMGWQFWI
jgi:hypothetical protein